MPGSFGFNTDWENRDPDCKLRPKAHSGSPFGALTFCLRDSDHTAPEISRIERRLGAGQ